MCQHSHTETTGGFCYGYSNDGPYIVFRDFPWKVFSFAKCTFKLGNIKIIENLEEHLFLMLVCFNDKMSTKNRSDLEYFRTSYFQLSLLVCRCFFRLGFKRLMTPWTRGEVLHLYTNTILLTTKKVQLWYKADCLQETFVE